MMMMMDKNMMMMMSVFMMVVAVLFISAPFWEVEGGNEVKFDESSNEEENAPAIVMFVIGSVAGVAGVALALKAAKVF